MKKKAISKLFENGGLIIGRVSNQLIEDLDYQDIVTLFEKYGVILFQGFDTKPEKLTNITDKFTEIYAVDALRRSARFNKKVIRDVDVGAKEVLLHSEASFTPAWPELIWFYCNTPPQKNGATILCDGIKLWNSLSSYTKNFFLLNPIRFELEIVIGKKKKGQGKRPWLLNSVGTGNGYINWDTGIFHVVLQKFAVHEGRLSNNLCFANHLFVKLNSEPQLVKRTMIDGKEIPKDILKEINEKAKKLIYEHKWKKGDLLMIDNKRFMHGRRAYEKNDSRDIVIIQSARASFGYGSTSRTTISKRQ